MRLERNLRRYGITHVGDATRHGYHVPGPLAALRDPGWRVDSAASSPRERAVAVSDARCKRNTGYVTVRSAAEARLQEELIVRFPARFAVLKQARDRLLRNAERFTGAKSRKFS